MPQSPPAGELSPAAAWSQRVRKVGGYIQLAFAAFWLIRGSLTIGGGNRDRPGGRRPRPGRRCPGLRHPGQRRDRPQAHQPGRQGHRAIGYGCHHHRADRLFRLSRHRHRSRPQRLGPALHRHHDRTATALARPSRAHPPLPSGRLGADHRARHPRGHHVRLRAHRHHRTCRRRPPAGHSRRRIPRPRGPPAPPLAEADAAQPASPVTFSGTDGT